LKKRQTRYEESEGGFVGNARKGKRVGKKGGRGSALSPRSGSADGHGSKIQLYLQRTADIRRIGERGKERKKIKKRHVEEGRKKREEEERVYHKATPEKINLPRRRQMRRERKGKFLQGRGRFNYITNESSKGGGKETL